MKRAGNFGNDDSTDPVILTVDHGWLGQMVRTLSVHIINAAELVDVLTEVLGEYVRCDQVSEALAQRSHGLGERFRAVSVQLQPYCVPRPSRTVRQILEDSEARRTELIDIRSQSQALSREFKLLPLPETVLTEMAGLLQDVHGMVEEQLSSLTPPHLRAGSWPSDGGNSGGSEAGRVPS